MGEVNFNYSPVFGLELDFGGVTDCYLMGGDAGDPAEGHGCGHGDIGKGCFHNLVGLMFVFVSQHSGFFFAWE